MSEHFYITTPIYYVNDIPHIGHAYTTIACDVISRYKRMKGYSVYFLTGTDEHGQKIQQAAQAQGISPQQLTDRIHLNFRNLWKTLNISNTDFIRTTEDRHIKTVQAIFSKLISQGDIYKGKYSGYYCVPCETYVPENAMGENHTCPDCGRPLTIMEEESYFFMSSKYVPELIEYYEAHPEAIKPRIRYNEVMSFLRGGVKDQSVSRTTLTWGIPVPEDNKHVIYVWFDALINYLSALGYPDGENFTHYWPQVRHMVGKDIIRFHCVTWPLMLLALGLPLPREIVAHGWWTVDGQKMSKSLKNVVDPLKMTAKYGLDAFRYFLMREVPFGNDGDFSEQALVGRINSDLANDLGNLLNRTLQMIHSYRGGKVPASAENSSVLSEILPDTLKRLDEAMNAYAYDEALKAIWEYIGRANKFIDETMPWKLAKAPEPSASERLDWVLLNLYEALRITAMMIAPYMPDTSAKIWSQLGQAGKPEDMCYNAFVFGSGAGSVIHKGEILFPRIDIEEWKKLQEQEKTPVIEKPEPKPEISIEDFGRVEMRVAEITKCEEIPKSKKLYKLEVNLGYETRTVCSGIKAFFTPEELTGKRVILVTNLKPVKLCGVESNGMILCASVKHDGKAEQLTLLTPEKDIPLGSLVS